MSFALAGEVDRDHRRRTVAAAHLVEVVVGQVLLPDDPDGRGRADVAGGEPAGDLDGLAVAHDGGAGDHAVGDGQLRDLAVEPQLSAVALEGLGERLPDADGALGAEAERLEGALAGEVGEEHAGRQILGADGEYRTAHVAEDAVHRLVLGVLGDPFGRGHLVLGKAGVTPRRADSLDDLRSLASEFAEQEAPSAAGDVDVLSAEAVQDRRLRRADVERRTDLVEGLLGDAAGLDDDGAVVHLETVDVVGRGATADLVETLDDQRPVAGVLQTRSGEQAASAGTDDEGVEFECVV